MTTRFAAGVLAVGGVLWAAAGLAAAPAQVSNRQAAFFENRIRPVLIERCVSCHGPTKQFNGFRADSRAALLKGGDRGPALAPGKPDESLLLKALRHTGELKMPPTGKLPDEVLEDVAEWIRAGAPWPEYVEKKPVAPSQPHWAFQPLTYPEVPRVKGPQPENPIDRFVLKRLQEKGLGFSPPPTRRQLLRRMFYDMLGTPPTPNEVEAFEREKSPVAWEQWVDRVLDDPRYGERWARHWLDVARYSDTVGYMVGDPERRYAYAYTYRHYVIRSLNSDKPYDRFVMEQLAADKLKLDDPRDQAALGFLTVGNRYLNNRAEIIDDRIDVVTRGLQGLTVQCARCHDHKFDPVPTADYYALYGVFNATMEPNELPLIGKAPDPKDEEAFSLEAERMEKRMAELRKMSGERAEKELGELREQLKRHIAGHPGAPPRAMVVQDVPNPANARILKRGNPGTPGDETPRGFVTLASRNPVAVAKDSSGRLEVARAIASPANPLTARVLVNRVWQWHFGFGLVPTPSDFGTRGDPPSHPELLDYLAGRFMKEGWSLKRLHRLILTSQTYCQASDTRAAGVKVDPDNRLLWRQNRRRLDFEQLRDTMLTVSGSMDRTVGGRSFVMGGADEPRRRTLYAFVDRQFMPTLLRTFDFPDANAHAPIRYTTTVPQQSLFMLNSPWVQQRASECASLSAAAPTLPARVTALFRTLLQRPPSREELDLARKFLSRVETLPTAAAGIPAEWRYGYGELTDDGRLNGFTPLPHFNGKAFQGGKQLPDPQLGWVTLNAAGGHPGDRAHAAVRRWIAPRDLRLEVSGTLAHPADQGDGVIGAVLAAGREVGRWKVRDGQVETRVASVLLKKGETLDFVTASGESVSFDGFSWAPRLRELAASSESWDAAAEFSGEKPKANATLSPWDAYAQALLLTNEFLYVD